MTLALQSRSPGRMWLFLCATLVLTLGRPGWAADRAKVRAVYEEAITHYKLGEIPQALAGFKESYRAVQDPAILFNIGQCYRQLNQYQDAIRAFKSYLHDAPDSDARKDVKDAIAQMETALREDTRAKAIPPTGLAGPNDKPAAAPESDAAKPAAPPTAAPLLPPWCWSRRPRQSPPRAAARGCGASSPAPLRSGWASGWASGCNHMIRRRPPAR